MYRMARRPALALGMVAAAMPALTTGTAAQMAVPGPDEPGPDEGRELAPGVRVVQYGKGPAILPPLQAAVAG